mgnify:CR=1 FL=1
MPSGDAIHAVDLPFVEMLEQGRDNTITAPARRSGALVAPLGTPTVSVYNASNVAVVDGATATVASSVATYAIPEATLADESLGEGWRVVWSLRLGGVEGVYDTTAALVRRRLFPVMSHDRLYKRLSSLDPSGTSPVHSRADFQDELDESWLTIQQRLMAAGRRPWLVVDPYSLAEVHYHLWLSMIYEDFRTRLSEAYREDADRHRAAYDDEWGKLILAYDDDDDGVADQRRAAAPAVLWTA